MGYRGAADHNDEILRSDREGGGEWGVGEREQERARGEGGRGGGGGVREMLPILMRLAHT